MFLSASPLRRSRWTEKVVTVKGLRVEIFDQREKILPAPWQSPRRNGKKPKIFDCEKGGLGASPNSMLSPRWGRHRRYKRKQTQKSSLKHWFYCVYSDLGFYHSVIKLFIIADDKTPCILLSFLIKLLSRMIDSFIINWTIMFIQKEVRKNVSRSRTKKIKWNVWQ